MFKLSFNILLRTLRNSQMLTYRRDWMVDDYDFVQGTLGITGVLATPLVRKQFSPSVTVRYCVE